jgi:ubiquinone/menaquinone biosynthesis C-methylase UbiE
MGFSFKGFFYQVFIDPLLKGFRGHVSSTILPGEKVIDVACGTGALSMAIARHADHVTGIDLSEDMIDTARRTAKKRQYTNVTFGLLDATDLSIYPDSSFDVAVSTMAMHQFDPETGLKVLREMHRLAKRIVIADYNYPMRPGLTARFSWSIERIAGGDHYRNYRKYMARGGTPTLIKEAGLTISSIEQRGKGVFMILQAL